MKQELGSQIVIRPKVDRDWEVTGYQIEISQQLSPQLRQAVLGVNQRSEGPEVAMEITRLKSVTAQRSQGTEDIEANIAVLTEELMMFPPDIVRTVCREWPRNHIYPPVLKEIRDLCMELYIFRQAVLDAMLKMEETKCLR